MKRTFAIAFLPLLFLANVRADDTPELQKILDAWKAREQNTKSIDFRWWSKCFESGAGPSKPDITYINKCRYLLDDQDRKRLERSGKLWIASKSDYVRSTLVDIHDGQNYKTQLSDDAHEVATAFVDSRDRFSLNKVSWIDPLTIAYRPFLNFANSHQSPKSAKSETIDGRQVIVLGFWFGEVCVDPAKENVPIRYTVRSGGIGHCQINLTYQNDPIDGWVPEKWTITGCDDDGHLIWSESANVAKYAINKPIDDSSFELDLNAGDIVFDNVRHKLYVRQADGTEGAGGHGDNLRINECLRILQIIANERQDWRGAVGLKTAETQPENQPTPLQSK